MRGRVITNIALVGLLFVLSTACGGNGIEEDVDKGFYMEEFQLLVPSLHGFEKDRPTRHDAREMILLRRGDGYIWLNLLGGFLTTTDIEGAISEIWNFAQSRVYSSAYLKGVLLDPLMIKKQEHPERPYLEQLLIVERTRELYELMDPIDLELRVTEIERFPVGRKMLIVNYYTPVGEDVYVMSFAAPPEDFLFWQDDAKRIFLELEFEVPTRPEGY
jgi:hypothetical protein